MLGRGVNELHVTIARRRCLQYISGLILATWSNEFTEQSIHSLRTFESQEARLASELMCSVPIDVLIDGRSSRFQQGSSLTLGESTRVAPGPSVGWNPLQYQRAQRNQLLNPKKYAHTAHYDMSIRTVGRLGESFNVIKLMDELS